MSFLQQSSNQTTTATKKTVKKQLTNAKDKIVQSSTSEQKMPDFKSPLQALTSSDQLVSPKEGGMMTSGTGQRGNIYHSGIDLAADEKTEIKAAAAGKIYYRAEPIYEVDKNGKIALDEKGNPKIIPGSEGQGGGGYSVMIDHGGGYQTYYGHMNKEAWKTNRKADGTDVKSGEKIGGVGSTGTSTGSHLHFEVRKNWTEGQNTEQIMKEMLKK
jgi:murein DD-endopeptidase MepM/ murein hydrolase activator NlpD